MNPASSLERTQVLPSTSVPNRRANANVSSLVEADGVSSTSAITGTGLKKCIPMTSAGRPAAAPSVAIGIDDVFEARTTSGRVTAPSRSKIRRFASASSVAASITRSASASACRSVAAPIRSSAAARSSSASLPRRDGRLQRALDAGPPVGDQLVGPLDEGHPEPGPGADLHDPGAHETAPDDPDMPNVLRFHGLRSPRNVGRCVR